MAKYVPTNEEIGDALRAISPTFRAHAEEADAAVNAAVVESVAQDPAANVVAPVAPEAAQA